LSKVLLAVAAVALDLVFPTIIIFHWRPFRWRCAGPDRAAWFPAGPATRVNGYSCLDAYPESLTGQRQNLSQFEGLQEQLTHAVDLSRLVLDIGLLGSEPPDRSDLNAGSVKCSGKAEPGVCWPSVLASALQNRM
jgi:hypothetical protein